MHLILSRLSYQNVNSLFEDNKPEFGTNMCRGNVQNITPYKALRV